MSTIADKALRLGRHVPHEWLLVLRYCLIEARPVVQVMFLLRYMCATVLDGGWRDQATLARTLAGAAVWELAVVCVYLFNGMMDITEDRINGSSRPIARGTLPISAAAGMLVVLGLVATLGGIALGREYMCLLLAFLTIGFLYSGPPCYLKRHAATGAATGISLGLLTYGAGHAAVSGVVPGKVSVIFALMVSSWTGLVGSITKDIPDLKGDSAAGRHSILVKWGEGVSRFLAACTACGLGGAFVLIAACAVPPLLKPAITMSCGAVLVTTMCLRGFPGGDRREKRRPYAVFMLTQYAVHVCFLVAIA
jgi:4-hydroxybenzoate polyprenyltransferase